MKFGKFLLNSQVPEWGRNYLAYKPLKQQIAGVAQQQKVHLDPSHQQQHGDADAASKDLVTSFFFQLDRELEKVNSFFLFKAAELERRVRILGDTFRVATAPSFADQVPETEDAALHAALKDGKEAVHRLQRFAALNSEAFRKILKKFDKRTGKSSQELYLKTKVRVLPFSDDSFFDVLLAKIEEMLTALEQRGADETTSVLYEASPVVTPTVASLASSVASMGISSRMSRARLGMSDAEYQALLVALQDDNVQALRALLSKFVDEREEFKRTPGSAPVFHGGSPLQPLRLASAATSPRPRALVRVMTNILILACQMQAKASIPYLLDEGATIDGAGDVNQQSLVCKLVIGGGVYASDVFKNSAITARSAAVASDTVEIIQLILDHIKDDSILEVADAFGRTALHYAAIKGHATIARFIVQRLKASRWGCTSGNIIGSTKLDSECHTALFYAVVGGHTDIVDALTDVDGVNVDDLTVVSVEPPSATTITPSATWHPQLAVGYIPRSYGQSQTPLALACKFNNADIVKLLLARGASPNFVDEDGETPLHLAVRSGHTSCVSLLCNHPNVVLNIQERVYGWTPLFLAAVEGYEECVRVLLAAGAQPASKDLDGWTPHEHAVFRGHMSIAGLLKPSTPYPLPPQIPRVTTISVPTVPPVAQPKAGRFYGHNYLTGRTLIIITLGSNDMKTAVAPVQLDLGSKRTLDPYAAMSLTISAINATGERAIVDLPIKDASEPILFYVDESVPITKDVAIQFDIIPTNGARKDVVARAVAVIDGVGGKNPSVDPRNAGKVKGRGGTMAVPLMNENREIVGRIQYECRRESGGANEISWTHVYNTTDFSLSHKRIDTVVTPFCHPRMSIGSKQTYWKFVETKVIGHRGAGANRALSSSLQIGENTVLSLVTAASLGAEYCEFDVQLTKDLVPVIYHDWILSETGLGIGVSSVSLKEFKQLDPNRNGTRVSREVSKSASWHDDSVLTYSQSSGLADLNHPHQSNVDKHARLVSRHLGGRGDGAIKAPFATLAELLQQVPPNVGFNVEVKYPNANEIEENGLDMAELNIFIDRILDVVYANAGNRSIIFSSFHPETCLMLNFKQPNYPVFFLTDAGMSKYYDPRLNSIQAAIRFAKFADLLGIVALSDPLLEAPSMIRTVKESGLLLFTYGARNNEPSQVDIQRRHGVDAVIVDKILPIVGSLRAAL